MKPIHCGLLVLIFLSGCVADRPDAQEASKQPPPETKTADSDEPTLDVIPASAESAAPADAEGFTKTASGLQYKIVREGSNRKPKSSSTVTCHYKGWLDNGREFDSSYKRNEPTSFPLNGVIPGWTEGLQLIGEGGEIELIIPSKLGYGPRGMPPTIPPNATLHFKVELQKVN